jgi:hypothetical protein
MAVIHVQRLRPILGLDEVIVGDLMLCEVLQDLENERAARHVEALLRRFEIVSMAGTTIAVAAARNFRFLRRRGITVRKTIDLLGASKTARRYSTTTAIFIYGALCRAQGIQRLRTAIFAANRRA